MQIVNYPFLQISVNVLPKMAKLQSDGHVVH